MQPLNTIKQQEQADLELYNPKTGEGLGSWLILAGPQHPMRERLELDKDRQLRKQINKRGTIELEEPEDDRRKLIDFLAACTLGWYTIEKVEYGGVEPPVQTRVDAIDVGNGPEPFSSGRVREIYQNKELGWIKDQAQAGLRKNDLFIKDSSRASSSMPAGSPASPN